VILLLGKIDERTT